MEVVRVRERRRPFRRAALGSRILLALFCLLMMMLLIALDSELLFVGGARSDAVFQTLYERRNIYDKKIKRCAVGEEHVNTRYTTTNNKISLTRRIDQPKEDLKSTPMNKPRVPRPCMHRGDDSAPKKA